MLAASLATLVAVVIEPHPARPLVPVCLGAVAGVSVLLAALRSAPWLLATGPQLALFALWTEAFVRHARTGLPIAKT